MNIMTKPHKNAFYKTIELLGRDSILENAETYKTLLNDFNGNEYLTVKKMYEGAYFNITPSTWQYEEIAELRLFGNVKNPQLIEERIYNILKYTYRQLTCEWTVQRAKYLDVNGNPRYLIESPTFKGSTNCSYYCNIVSYPLEKKKMSDIDVLKTIMVH